MKVTIYLTDIPGADRIFTSTVKPTGEWVARIKANHPGARVFETDVTLPDRDPPVLDGKIRMRGLIKEL